MEFIEKESLLRRIATKKTYTTVSIQGNEIDVIFEDPSLEISREADWIYEKTYKKYKNSTDFITVEESHKILEQDGKWSKDKEKEIVQLNNDMVVLQQKLPFLQYQKAEQRKIKKTIENAEKRIQILETEKNQLYHLTLEHFCHNVKKRFLIQKITKSIDSSVFLDLNNNHTLDILGVYYFEESSIAMKDIRELARTDPWRLYWIASKDSGLSLLPHSAVEMSDWQYLLILWSRIYDYAFNSNEPPPNSVLEDDYQFDAWYKNQVSNKQSFDASQVDTGNGLQEVFIMADAEGAPEVLALNNPQAIGRIKSINKNISEKGEVNEIDLPDTQKELRMLANQAQPPR